ncbi:transcriptional regulator PpsR [soil metagenome]
MARSGVPPYRARFNVTGIFEKSTAPLAGKAGPVLDRVVRASADVVLHLDAGGRVLEVYRDPAIIEENLREWIGRIWAETVLPDTRTKVAQLLDDARANGISRTRQVNQTLPGGIDLPIGYTGVLIDEDDGFLVLGRNLQSLSDLQRRLVEAQQALERDYWRLRQMETRYRLLFQRSSEALLVLEAPSRRILDANRAAGQAFGVPPRKLTGRVFPEELTFADRSRDEIRRHLEGVRDHGRAETVTLELGNGDGWRLDAAVVQEERDGILLVHLQEARTGPAGPSPSTGVLNPARLLEHGPDPFVVTDRDARVLMANRAFRMLVQIPAEEELTGHSLGRWLGRPGADMTVLLTNLEKFGEVRLFPTTLHSALDLESEVELSATPIHGADPPCIGITIRNVSRRIWTEGALTAKRDLSRAVEQLPEQVGKVSLKQLVQNTVGIVEAHFIESALKLTDGNRTAAAEILGVSRQSLYTKLRRYDVDGGET